jgi:hypothetical protein
MAEDINKVIVRRFWEEVLGQGNLRVADQILDPACTLNAPGLLNGEIGDSDEVRNIVEQIRSAFPDFHVTIEELETTADGDVVAGWNGTGTHTGCVGSVEPTGALREWWGVSASRLSDDNKIVEMRWATISRTAEDTWTAMELDSVVELVPREETAPDEEVYRRRPKPLWCCVIRC